MHYKTIVLELLRQVPELHARLKESRSLLPTLDRLAGGLKESHAAWKERLARDTPNSGRAQTTSAALELALAELEAALRPASPPDGGDQPSPDGVTADLRHHSHPA